MYLPLSLMKFRLFIQSIFILLLLTGCLHRKSSLAKVWFFTLYTGNLNDSAYTLTPASFLNLQKGGSYTSDFGTFEYGTWTRNKDTLHLSNGEHKTTDIIIDYFSPPEMRIHADGMASASFESQPSSFTTSSENPFSKENNLWRVHATRKESDEEINKRLQNHLRFWELYFSWALNSGINSIDVRSTPTLIKIYGNGFALKPFTDLPPKWKSYFYDDADCRKANAMIKTVFDKHDIAWAHTDNKYKLFISAFQQLQQFLK